MPRVELPLIPDHGRVWVFPASRRLGGHEAEALLAEVDAFLESWAAHGSPLRSARELHDGWFLVIGVDEDAEAPSGCSIDALVNRLKVLGEELGLTLVEHGPVWFRHDGAVTTRSRADFRRLAQEGGVDLDTPVFDTTITRLTELRAKGLERSARDSWHGRGFFGRVETG